MKVYQKLAIVFNAVNNCKARGNNEWIVKHTQTINDICNDNLPHGSGFDSGTHFDFDKSRDDRLVIYTEFHHMDGNGYYIGWTKHGIIVTPSLAFGFNIRVTGVDKRGIKEYIAEVFNDALDAEYGK